MWVRWVSYMKPGEILRWHPVAHARIDGTLETHCGRRVRPHDRRRTRQTAPPTDERCQNCERCRGAT